MLSESLHPFFDWCGRTWIGTAVRDTVWAFPLIETVHLLALSVLLGTVLLVNLRVFGLGQRYYPSAAQIAREFEPWMLASLGVLIASGIPMFLSEPQKCYESYSFPIKMLLLVLGIGSQFTIQRRWVIREPGEFSTTKAKLAACISILVWTGVGLAGKGIPYV